MENLIFEKITAIMAEIEPIAKGRKNQQQGYSYRGVDDVMNELSPIMAKHKVFPVTRVIQDAGQIEPIVSSKGNAGYHFIRLYVIRLYTTDGSFVEGIIEGEASDFGDKAAGKAHSYAYRDFLMKTFVIPTEGDHDTDAKTPEVKAQPTKTISPQATGKPTMNDSTFNTFCTRLYAEGEELLEKAKKAYSLTIDQISKAEIILSERVQ
jgi:hypothetical protein